MKSEFQIYMETGIIGGYIPERVIAVREEDKITPIFRDSSYWETENGAQLHREMIVGGRRFLIRSIFSMAEKAKTPAEQVLQIIDSDTEKDSI